MNCPQCQGYQLEPKEIESGLVAGACPKCEGTLLSLMNYRFWNDKNPSNLKVDSNEIEVNEPHQKAIDNSSALTCPKCSRFMSKFNVGSGSSNRIDLCTGCDEAWLDKGEWRLLNRLDLQGQLPKIFTDAWQRNVRIERKENNFKKRYETLLGKDDFKRIDEFKSWLNEHTESASIRHYLNAKMD